MTNKHFTALEVVAKPFIQAGFYESEADFFAELAKDLAQRKIRSYQSKVQRFEKKHQSWEKFSQEIQGGATPHHPNLNTFPHHKHTGWGLRTPVKWVWARHRENLNC